MTKLAAKHPLTAVNTIQWTDMQFLSQPVF